MPIVLFLLFVAVPLLEIALLIKFGQSFGFWPTIGLVIVTALLGSVLLRQQGFAVWRRVQEDLQSGRPPVEPVADGMLLLVAGAFLVAPGLITDTTGILLLIPPVRAVVRRFIARRLAVSGAIFTSVRQPGRPAAEPGAPRPSRSKPSSSGTVIDGEFERLDEQTKDPRWPNSS